MANVVPLFASLRTKPPAWAIYPLARERTITILAAEPGAGKTTLLLWATIAAAQGKAMLGTATTALTSVRPLRTLYFALDGPAYDYQYLANRVCAGQALVPTRATPFLFCHRRVDVLVPGELEKVLEQAERTEHDHEPVDVVVFDAIRAIHTGDENDSSHMSMVTKRLRDLAESGPAVILTHHFGKAAKDPKAPVRGLGAMRGSTILDTDLDMQVHLMRVPDAPDHFRRLEWAKGRGADVPSAIGLQMYATAEHILVHQ
jgi:RecA-family ATPase